MLNNHYIAGGGDLGRDADTPSPPPHSQQGPPRSAAGPMQPGAGHPMGPMMPPHVRGMMPPYVSSPKSVPAS